MVKSDLDCLALYSAFTKKELVAFVRNTCTEDEIKNLNVTYQAWNEAREQFQLIQDEEKGIADNCEIKDIDSHLIDAIMNHRMIKNSYGNEDYELKMVNLDQVVIEQRELILNYTNRLENEISFPPNEKQLLKFCLTPEKRVARPKAKKGDSSTYYFSSPSKEFRFLGGHLKEEVTIDDIEKTGIGGLPTHAVILFLGYPSFCMSGYKVGGRVIMNNGTHRAYTLASNGVKKVPMLLINRTRSDFPEKLQGLKKDYLLLNPRPIMLKDYLNNSLTRQFKQKETRMIVKVNWNTGKLNIEL
jgi:hypothetical protein